MLVVFKAHLIFKYMLILLISKRMLSTINGCVCDQNVCINKHILVLSAWFLVVFGINTHT